MRGHAHRSKQVKHLRQQSMDSDEEDDDSLQEATECLQASMKGHLARKSALKR